MDANSVANQAANCSKRGNVPIIQMFPEHKVLPGLKVTGDQDSGGCRTPLAFLSPPLAFLSPPLAPTVTAPLTTAGLQQQTTAAAASFTSVDLL